MVWPPGAGTPLASIRKAGATAVKDWSPSFAVPTEKKASSFARLELAVASATKACPVIVPVPSKEGVAAPVISAPSMVALASPVKVAVTITLLPAVELSVYHISVSIDPMAMLAARE